MFIYPCLPIPGEAPPKGAGWAHQPKWDGYRLLVAKDGDSIRLFSKGGTEWTDHLAGLAEAFLELPTLSAVLAGELCICDDRGRPNFKALHCEMRQDRPDVSRMAFFAFDILFQNNVDLRSLTFSERQRDLKRLCGHGHVPCLYLVETFPEGGALLEWCSNYGLEGIVSKRRVSGYDIVRRTRHDLHAPLHGPGDTIITTASDANVVRSWREPEAGCSAHEIQSITGHRTLQMVEHYTKAARQKRLASAAITKLEGTGTEPESGKLDDGSGKL